MKIKKSPSLLYWLSLSIILTCTVQSLASTVGPTSCQGIFSGPVSSSLNSFPDSLLGLKNHFKDEGDHAVGILVSNLENRKKWTAHLENSGRVRPEIAFRAMNATSAELKEILQIGIQPSAKKYAGQSNRSHFDRVFAAQTPNSAFWDSLYKGFYFNPIEPQYIILMEIEKNHPISKWNDDPAATNAIENIVFDYIYPEQIKRFYFADPNSMTPDFPFREYSLEELRKLFSIANTTPQNNVVTKAMQKSEGVHPGDLAQNQAAEAGQKVLSEEINEGTAKLKYRREISVEGKVFKESDFFTISDDPDIYYFAGHADVNLGLLQVQNQETGEQKNVPASRLHKIELISPSLWELDQKGQELKVNGRDLLFSSDRLGDMLIIKDKSGIEWIAQFRGRVTKDLKSIVIYLPKQARYKLVELNDNVQLFETNKAGKSKSIAVIAYCQGGCVGRYQSKLDLFKLEVQKELNRLKLGDKVEIEKTGCFGQCDQGINAQVKPGVASVRPQSMPLTFTGANRLAFGEMNNEELTAYARWFVTVILRNYDRSGSLKQ